MAEVVFHVRRHPPVRHPDAGREAAQVPNRDGKEARGVFRNLVKHFHMLSFLVVHLRHLLGHEARPRGIEGGRLDLHA